MNWSFSNNSSAVPQFLCFQQQEDMPKPGFDSLVSPRLLNMPAANTFRSDHKSQHPGFVQKEHVTSHDRKHARVRYSVNQLEKDTVNTTPQRNMSALKSVTPCFDTAAASRGSADGSTDSSRNSTKITKDPQLTIFYNGSVFVYDGVSPEKARAILFLAGNNSLAACSISAPSEPVHESPNIDGLVANQGISSKKSNTMPRDQVSKRGDGLVVRQSYGASSSHVTTIPSNTLYLTATARVSTNGDNLVVSQPYGVSSTHVHTIPSNVSFSLTPSRNSSAGEGATACLSRVSRISGSSMPRIVGRSSDEAKRAKKNRSHVQRKTASTLDSVRVSGNDDDEERPIGILESSWNVPDPPRTAYLQIHESVPATSKPSGGTMPLFYRRSLEDFRYKSKDRYCFSLSQCEERKDQKSVSTREQRKSKSKCQST